MQQEDEDKDPKMDSSSFRVVIDSPNRIPPAAAAAAADLQIKEGSSDNHRKVADIGTEDDDDLDFTFVRVPQNPNPLSSADEIFSQGTIRPVYPLFGRHILIHHHHNNNYYSRRSLFSPAVAPAPKGADPKPIRGPLRRLFIEEERDHGSSSSSSSSSSSLDELDGIPPGTYCVWTPKKKADRCTKSRSSGSGSGSSSFRWRLRDLVSGRSRSDGKEKFGFINPMMERRQEEEEDKGKTDEVTVPKRLENCGGQSGQELEALKTAGKRSFLPYNRIGLLTNGKASSSSSGNGKGNGCSH